MLKIRLSRTGKKRQPSFRVVVQEHTAPIKGKFVESIGYFRPADDPKVFSVDLERVKHWLSVGAQPSDTVAVLLKKEGIEGLDKYIITEILKIYKRQPISHFCRAITDISEQTRMDRDIILKKVEMLLMVLKFNSNPVYYTKLWSQNGKGDLSKYKTEYYDL